MPTKLKINRAPVLTLWAVVVAERLGHPQETALTLGKALAGLNAQSKGQRLGIFEPAAHKEAEKEKPASQVEEQTVRLLGRQVPVQKTEQGLRAEADGKPIDPAGVEKYLRQKFKDTLPEVRQAMQELAKSVDPQTLEKRGFELYEKFRPQIPEGKRGWGAAGELDVEKITALKEN
jgi:hypothetical protein